jgi:hypothetical protein
MVAEPLTRSKVHELTLWCLWDEVECSVFAANALAGSVDPDVRGDDLAVGQLQISEALQDGLVDLGVWRVFQHFYIDFLQEGEKKFHV